MIDAHAPIAVSMTAECWQQVLNLLGAVHAPHQVTDPLIRDIHQQCLAADRPGTTTLREVGDAS